MDEDFNVITITSTSATIDGETYNILSVTSDTIELAYVDDPTYKVTLTLTSDGKLTDGTLEYSKYNSSDTPTVEIDESLQGTWKDDENNVTLIISVSSVNWNGIDCTGAAYDDEGYLTFKYDDAVYEGSYNS